MAKTEESLPLPLERRLYFAEQVDQKSIVDVTKQILEINEDDSYLERLYDIHGIKYKPKPIEIYIDSYGGNVYQVLGLIGVMEKSTVEIHTYVTGCAMSCGFMILITGHKRFAYQHSTPLYHQVSTGFYGNVSDMEIEYKEGKRLQRKLEKLTLEKTKITQDKLDQIYKTKTDWFMSAKDALKYGVVDAIV